MRTRSMVRSVVVAGVAAILALVSTAAAADPGDPDPGWSGDGLARDGLGDGASGVRVLVLGNGKVIVAGDIDEGGPTGTDVLLARYTKSGVLDTTFSGDGYRSIAVSNVYDTAWALARGYQVANVDGIKVADLAATADRLPALAALAAEKQGDYELVCWPIPVPEEHLQSLGEAMSLFLSQIPLGDLDLEPEVWTPERLRRVEARRIAQRRDVLTVAALTPAGEVAGYTSVGVAPHAPRVCGIGETIVLPYNDVAAVEAAFAEYGDQIACVITEAAAGNMGAVPPMPGFNAALRDITQKHGSLLIMDEVMTGFRVSSAGWFGLDPVSAEVVHRTARAHADAGHAVVWVTHDLVAAEQICDRVALVAQRVLHVEAFAGPRAVPSRSRLLSLWHDRLGSAA